MLKTLEVCCKIIPKPLINRLNCTREVGSWSSKAVQKQARFMNKLIAGSKKRSKQTTQFQAHPKSSDDDIMFAKPKTASKKKNRRQTILNTVFAKKITDMMYTGNYADQIYELGITISRVEISFDYSGLNVYWTKTTQTNEELVEPTLLKTASELRHQLTQLRVMGKVPPIKFVRDRSIFQYGVMDDIFRTADYGDDFVPTFGANLRVADFHNENLNETNCKKVEKSEKEVKSESEDKIGTEQEKIVPDEEFVPPMRQNVFGLDRLKIINRLMVAKEREVARITAIKGEGDEVSDEKPIRKSILHDLVEFDNKQFTKYILKKKFEKRKLADTAEKASENIIVRDEVVDDEADDWKDIYEENYDHDYYSEGDNR